ncbi:MULTISPECIES: fimbrial protein [Pseudomonas]|uniref:fimbrial protein n=1 Tax=Pseudomonas TaxID=286 RepID=UPI0010BF8D24|nr:MULTISPECIES: fimbrial protein [Pseudomonas]MBD8193365.1 fimbrial protein [Pseudomonas fluorescens]MBD8228547.1 fimbrial protein [Pseudomonas fluorescens]MBD8737900.1 fimbrial protein [Pseudomonas fluorescens]MBD8786518.1 fimbrial protein [Pseudomonas fluorescens]MBD8818382.1 fimbrial protein [Pseudomonas fluorescens]
MIKNLSLAALAAFINVPAFAADTVNINVRGTMTRPPCTLTSATALTANFNSVRTDEISSAPVVSVPVKMTCPSGSSLNMSFTSTNGTISATVAKTNVTNLGVALLYASDSSAANMEGVKKAFTGLNGSVDLSLNAKLVSTGTVAVGSYSSALVLTIDYL